MLKSLLVSMSILLSVSLNTAVIRTLTLVSSTPTKVTGSQRVQVVLPCPDIFYHLTKKEGMGSCDDQWQGKHELGSLTPKLQEKIGIEALTREIMLRNNNQSPQAYIDNEHCAEYGFLYCVLSCISNGKGWYKGE